MAGRASCGTCVKHPRLALLLNRMGLSVLALALMALLAPSALAQSTIRFTPSPWRLTIPVGTNGNVTSSNWIRFSTNVASDITFTALGLPADTSMEFAFGDYTNAFVTNNVYVTNNPFNTYPLFIFNNNTNLPGYNNTMRMRVFFTNVPSGYYPFEVRASGGATGTIAMILESAYVWSGPTNSRILPPGVWTSGTSWSNGVAPSLSTDHVVFKDVGGQWDTNATFVSTNATTTNLVYTTNILVSSDVTVNSVRFAQEVNASRYHNLVIGAGARLKVVGTNGFTLSQDNYAIRTSGNPINDPVVNIIGDGTLEVTNQSGFFGIFPPSGNQTDAPLINATNLATMVLDVDQVTLGNYRTVVNYANYNSQNQFQNGPIPKNLLASIFWAKTNVVTARHADPVQLYKCSRPHVQPHIFL